MKATGDHLYYKLKYPFCQESVETLSDVVDACVSTFLLIDAVGTISFKNSNRLTRSSAVGVLASPLLLLANELVTVGNLLKLAQV